MEEINPKYKLWLRSLVNHYVKTLGGLDLFMFLYKNRDVTGKSSLDSEPLWKAGPQVTE